MQRHRPVLLVVPNDALSPVAISHRRHRSIGVVAHRGSSSAVHCRRYQPAACVIGVRLQNGNRTRGSRGRSCHSTGPLVVDIIGLDAESIHGANNSRQQILLRPCRRDHVAIGLGRFLNERIATHGKIGDGLLRASHSDDLGGGELPPLSKSHTRDCATRSLCCHDAPGSVKPFRRGRSRAAIDTGCADRFRSARQIRGFRARTRRLHGFLVAPIGIGVGGSGRARHSGLALPRTASTLVAFVSERHLRARLVHA